MWARQAGGKLEVGVRPAPGWTSSPRTRFSKMGPKRRRSARRPGCAAMSARVWQERLTLGAAKRADGGDQGGGAGGGDGWAVQPFRGWRAGRRHPPGRRRRCRCASAGAGGWGWQEERRIADEGERGRRGSGSGRSGSRSRRKSTPASARRRAWSVGGRLQLIGFVPRKKVAVGDGAAYQHGPQCRVRARRVSCARYNTGELMAAS